MSQNLARVLDIDLTVSVVLGRTKMPLKDILELRNKARLQNRKMNNDKNKENSSKFIDIIHKINKLLNVIDQLVIKGDIKMHHYSIKLSNKQIQIIFEQQFLLQRQEHTYYHYQCYYLY